MKNSMKMITSSFQGVPTFKLIPINRDCPYLEMVFIPSTKSLSIVSKDTYEGFNFFFKIDENGNKIPLSGNKKDPNTENLYKQERLRIQHFYEYTLLNRDEINDFVFMFGGVSSSEIDKFFIVPEISNVPSVETAK